ncbi:MAG: DUF2818 family protein [Pseudomonadota bacterium]
MSTTAAVWILLGIAFIAANLPWLSERVFFVFTPKKTKSAWLRLLEWLVLYFIVGLIALGLEQKLNGAFHAQDWEFYAVNFCLFLVFALPGFIYRYDLKPHLQKR